jgi:hypothetical protein
VDRLIIIICPFDPPLPLFWTGFSAAENGKNCD